MKKLLIIAAISLMGMSANAQVSWVHCPATISYHANGGQIGPKDVLLRFYSAAASSSLFGRDVGSCTYTNSEYPYFAIQIFNQDLSPSSLIGNVWTHWPTKYKTCGYGIDPLQCPFLNHRLESRRDKIKGLLK